MSPFTLVVALRQAVRLLDAAVDGCKQNAGEQQRERLNLATLTIRDLEDEIVTALKERARCNDRSLEAEVREILRDAAVGGSPESLRDLADRIAALTPDVRQTDSTELVRGDRGR